MKLPAFDYAAPDTLPQALDILTRHGGDARVIAGGQSLLPLLAFRMAAPSLLVDLRKLRALARIAISHAGVELGAMVRWCDIEAHGALRAAHPLLAAATACIAHHAIRNRGTVGGSLAHADFAAELPGIAVVCDAEIVAASTRGERRIPAGEFFLSPLTTALAEDEVITTLALPPWSADRRWAFREFSRQRGGFPLAGVALHYDERDGITHDAHVTVIAAHGRLERLNAAEDALNGRAPDADAFAAVSRAASDAIDPVTDLEGSAEYRRALVGTLMARALEESVTRPAARADRGSVQA